MKVRGKEKVQTKSAGARFTDMRTEQDVASPAAAVLERRQTVWNISRDYPGILIVLISFWSGMG